MTLRTLPLTLLLAFPAAAETLYDRDGVQLTASTRLINADAATCRIREDRHSVEEYEKLRHNEGQPMSVWRAELVVANYSGKVLDYLNAHLNVRSEWPSCDDWDGLGNYGKPVVWTGPLMTIHEVSIVQPGEERREVEFILALHDQEPAFGRWDIDYEFADDPSSEDEVAPTRLPAGIRPEDTCPGVAPSCWQEIVNQPGCYLWNSGRVMLSIVSEVTWTGGCSDGRASGIGERSWKTISGTGSGELRNGKATGHWTVRHRNGAVEEGPYVDGKRNGHWIVRHSGGSVEEGPYVDGQKHGRWTGELYNGTKFGPDCYSNGEWVEC